MIGQWRRSGGWIWLAVGIAAVSAVMLIDLGRLLGDVESRESGRSYDAGIFTNPRLFVWNTEDLANAIRSWRLALPTVPNEFGVQTLLSWHIAVDAFLFTPAYCFLIWRVMKRYSVEPWFVIRVPKLIFAADQLENLATWSFVRNLSVEHSGLVVVQALTFFKWLFIAIAAVTALGGWWSMRRKISSAAEHPARPLSGLIVLVVLFGALIALPAGGPLEQLPDVLRAHWLRGWPVLYLSGLAFALFVAAVAVAGFACTVERVQKKKPIRNGWIVGLAFVLSVVLCLVAWWFDDRFNWAPASYFLVASTIWLASVLFVKSRPLAEHARGSIGTHSLSPLQRRFCHEGDGDKRGDRERARQWVGALCGAIIVIGGLGLVRAAFPPMVVGSSKAGLPWEVITIYGSLIAMFGGYAGQWIVARLGASASGQPWYRNPSYVTGILVLLLAAYFARWPSQAQHWGTTGVVAGGFAFLATMIGLLKWASRRLPPWEATVALRLGNYTSWLTLLAITWTLASVLNVDGVYHDARVVPAAAASHTNYRYPELQTAFNAWIRAQTGACAPAADQVVPLVLVAAPGGGIRASHWTTQTLETLFGKTKDACAVRRLFAISGVSGGSVGAATWVAALEANIRPIDALEGMANDHALAEASAGLLLRDLFQPLVGISTKWRDRAALLEDGWKETARKRSDDNNGSATSVFPFSAGRRYWSQLGSQLDWMPILVLNSSSVNDGRRVLISNVGQLPSSYCAECADQTAQAHSGPVSSSLDAFAGLFSREKGSEKDCGPNAARSSSADMEVTTAALLSARFPYVSTSGALLRCVPTSSDPVVTYAVDGGYYENSGLLTLLQIWTSIEPLVREYNRTVGSGAPIAPWIVVADNAYRSVAIEKASRRPLEVFAPLQTRGNDNALLDQGALEQMASSAIRSQEVQCGIEKGQGPLGPSCMAQTWSRCMVVISPMRRPSVAAPLGWVLSETSKTDLKDQHARRLSEVAGVSELRAQLAGASMQPDPPCVWKAQIDSSTAEQI